MNVEQVKNMESKNAPVKNIVAKLKKRKISETPGYSIEKFLGNRPSQSTPMKENTKKDSHRSKKTREKDDRLKTKSITDFLKPSRSYFYI